MRLLSAYELDLVVGGLDSSSEIVVTADPFPSDPFPPFYDGPNDDGGGGGGGQSGSNDNGPSSSQFFVTDATTLDLYNFDLAVTYLAFYTSKKHSAGYP